MAGRELLPVSRTPGIGVIVKLEVAYDEAEPPQVSTQPGRPLSTDLLNDEAATGGKVLVVTGRNVTSPLARFVGITSELQVKACLDGMHLHIAKMGCE